MSESTVVRTAKSLKSKWDVIRRDVSSFAGAFSRVVQLNSSGATQETMVEMAIGILNEDPSYVKAKGTRKSFDRRACWEVLKDEPKWKAFVSDEVEDRDSFQPSTTRCPSSPHQQSRKTS